MKRILVVDGDMTVRAQIGRYARLEGYDVAEASDGYTAVALCRDAAGAGWIFRLSDYPQLFTGPDLDPVREGR